MPEAAPVTEKPRSIPSVQYRAATFERESIVPESREIRLTFSSEAPVRMLGIEEILDHSTRAVRLDRLRNSGPFLWNHDRNAVLGRITDVQLERGKMRATVRFSKSAFADEKWRDVQDGILRETSIGYRVYGTPVLERSTAEVDTFRVMDWEPFEGSLVIIPADTSVGVGRAAAPDQDNPPVNLPTQHFRTMETPAPAAPVNTPAPAAPVISTAPGLINLDGERSRISAIDTMADKFKDKVPNVLDAARSAIRDGKSLDEFRTWLLEDGLKAKPINTSAPALADMEKDGKRSYSLRRVICSQVPDLKNTVDVGFEREVSDALRKAAVGGTKRKGDFTAPSEIFGIGLRDVIVDDQRTMQATTPSSGGYSVATDLAQGIIQKLDNMMVVGRLGVRRLSGLQGNLTICRQTGGATAYWVAESGAITDSELTFDLLGLVPHTVGATSPYSKQLLQQSSSDIESFLRADLQKRLAITEDLAFFQGTSGAQPLGIFNLATATTEGTPVAGKTTKVTYGAAATWADVVGIIADLMEANVIFDGTFKHVISPATWAKWATKSVDTGSGRFIWNGTAEDGNVGGYAGTVTNHLPGDYTASGVWSNSIWAQWGGTDVVVDPYALKKQQAIEVTTYDMVDFGHEHPEAIAISTDSGAQ